MQGSKVSKGARKRGQLSSLLVEAYQNREVLEERIAEGRRNRKEAGNKYGAFHSIRAGTECRLTFRKGFNNYHHSYAGNCCSSGSFSLRMAISLDVNEAANGWIRLYSDD